MKVLIYTGITLSRGTPLDVHRVWLGLQLGEFSTRKRVHASCIARSNVHGECPSSHTTLPDLSEAPFRMDFRLMNLASVRLSKPGGRQLHAISTTNTTDLERDDGADDTK